MKRLGESPSTVTRSGRREWRGELKELKGGIKLEITADRPFSLHLLDEDRLMGNESRCDGLLVSEANAGLTCLLELKGAIDAGDVDKPFDQIASTVEHFAPKPGGSVHGEAHHAAWRTADDLPAAPQGTGRLRALALAPEHHVAGAIIVMRGGTRHPPRVVTVAGRSVYITPIQRHGSRGRITLSLDELEAATAWPPDSG